MSELNKFLIVVFLALELSIWFAYSQSIVVFTEYNHKSNQTEVDISTCNHLPKTMEKKVVGINTKGNCARFYASDDCSGNFIEILPRSPSHHYLSDWGFKNVTVSVGPCRDQCSVNITGPVPTEDGLNVTLFDRPFYRGVMETINVKGCHIIPRKFNYRVYSANTKATEKGQCFQLYNNVDCQMNWTAGHDSVELGPGTPYHHDLRQWRIYPVKAVSHCSYKCKNESDVGGISQNEEQLTDGNQVMLFDEINFKGNGLLINKTEDCVNLDQFGGWEGATKSVKLLEDEPTCVVLHGVPNCSGNYLLKLNSSKAELYTSKFDTILRSIEFCDPTAADPLT